MAIFNNMSITNKGQALYAKVQAGIELKFTKMMVGSGDIDARNPATLLDLIEPKYTVGIQNMVPNTEAKTALISGTIDNRDMTEAVYICEIGLYAQDPDEGEILYAYGTAGKYGDYYAPASRGPFTWNYQINAAIGNAANISIILSNLSYDYGISNTNTTFLVISGATQKELNKSIDTNLNKINTSLNDITKKIDNIDLSAEKVKLSGVTGIEATDVKAAIQELFTNASDGQSAVAGEVGIDTKSTWANIKSSILSAKNTIVANLKNKAVNTDNTQSLATLASKIASIPTQAAQTITPGTTNKTITANRFLTGIQTILGDANLIAANIIAGKSIFGVAGSASIESLGGVRIATGTIAIPHVKYFNGNVNLGFTPNVIVIKINVDNQWYDDKGFYNNSSFPVLNTGTSYRMSNRISSDKLAVLVETDRDSGSIRYVVPITNGFYYAAQVSLGAGYYLEYTALRI